MKSKKTKALILNIIICAFGFVMVYPVLWLIASSFKDPSSIFVNQASLIPIPFVPQNYVEGWKGFGGVSFATFFTNSFVITGLSTIGQVLSSVVIAFGFARVDFKFKKVWFTCMILTLMLPSQVLIIPQYVMFNSFGWVGTYLPLIVPAFFGTPFFIFMIMQFVQGIPYDLDESAYLDGCTKYGIFARIIVPLVVPALVTCMIFAFYWKWDDFLGPLLYVSDISRYPVSMALRMFADPASVSNWGAMYAMASLSILPVISIFFGFQKYLVEGISTTGIKG